MTSQETLDAAKTKTYELVGRNLVQLQHWEKLLKRILPAASMDAGDGAELKSRYHEGTAKLEGQTLGNLVRRFAEEVLASEEAPIPEPSQTPSIAVSLHVIHRSEEGRQKECDRLQQLVESRNRLVHHLISEITPDDPQSWLATHPFLVELKEAVQKEIGRLHEIANASAMGMSAGARLYSVNRDAGTQASSS